MANYRNNITVEAMDAEVNATSKKNYKNSFDVKNYLNVKLGPTEDSKELKIRLLPVDKNTNSPFKTIYMHTIKLPKAIDPKESWKSFVCLSKTEDIDHETLGHKCPFCELNHSAYVKFTEAETEVEKERWKEISTGARATEVCVVRCIERGHEEDGPKFWKFTVRSDGKDPKSMIKKLYKDRLQESIDEAKEENGGELPDDFVPENILDLENGKDLKITISAVYDKEGKRTNKTSISVVDYGKNKPLSSDDELAESWVNDGKVWSDVFVAKPYEYCDLVLQGLPPYYDKANERWIARPDKDGDKETDSRDDAEDVDEKIKKAEEKAAGKSTKRQNIVEEYEEPEEDDTPF